MYTSIIKLLESQGYEAFIEGETARDIYMQRTPKRNCVAVAATFEELQQNFGDYITHKVANVFPELFVDAKGKDKLVS